MSVIPILYDEYKKITQNLPNPLTYGKEDINFKIPQSSKNLLDFSLWGICKTVGFEIDDNKCWIINSHCWVVDNFDNYRSRMCPITKLVIDKISGDVAYNDLQHKYWNIKTGEFYTSVTTFLKKFQPEFDAELISTYKAIEYLYPDIFKILKSQRLSMLSLVETFKKNHFEDNKVKIFVTDYANKFQLEWKEKGYQSAKKGTIEHEKREKLVYENKSVILFNKKLGYRKNYRYINDDIRLNLYEYENFLKSNVLQCFPETLVYSHKFKLAGQIDLLAFDFILDKEHCEHNSIDIYDYKTNQSIDVSNKFQKLFSPFDFLENCNFNIYSMQLSLYSILVKEMFEETNDFKVNLNLIHVKDTNDMNKDVSIECKDFSNIILNYLLKEKYNVKKI